jgi:hypothetical protein
MAMHDSSEFAGTASTLFQQFETLVTLPAKARTYISIIDAGADTATVWMTQTGGEIMELFAELNARGRTILMVTHERAFSAWSDREIEMKDGRITSDRRQNYD